VGGALVDADHAHGGRVAKAQMAHEAISHRLECPYENPLECPDFVGLVAARLEGRPLQEAHAALR
jgi:hypothetical protein